MDKIIGIYKIENKVNGHFYIGQSVNINGRWSEHKSDLKRKKHDNCHLQRAWDKYGKDNFVHEIIEICDVRDLDEREKYWITFYDAINPLKGYNILSGGQDSHDIPEETRAKLSLAGMGRVVSEETRKRISEKNKGRKNTDEQNLHISLACQFASALRHPDTWYKNKTKLPAKRTGEYNPFSKYTESEIKTVIQMLLDNKSNVEISRETGITKDAVCKIRIKETWKYLTEGLEFPYVRYNKFTKEMNNKILDDIKSGLGRQGVMNKYNIGASKFYKLKNSLKEVS